MSGYEYVDSFFAGMFLANFVPHFIQGISGNRFPTPFANPPGRGLSSPTVNVLWGLLNLAVGMELFRMGEVGGGNFAVLAVFFAGMAALSVPMSLYFSRKHKQ